MPSEAHALRVQAYAQQVHVGRDVQRGAVVSKRTVRGSLRRVQRSEVLPVRADDKDATTRPRLIAARRADHRTVPTRAFRPRPGEGRWILIRSRFLHTSITS